MRAGLEPRSKIVRNSRLRPRSRLVTNLETVHCLNHDQVLQFDFRRKRHRAKLKKNFIGTEMTESQKLELESQASRSDFNFENLK